MENNKYDFNYKLIQIKNKYSLYVSPDNQLYRPGMGIICKMVNPIYNPTESVYISTINVPQISRTSMGLRICINGRMEDFVSGYDSENTIYLAQQYLTIFQKLYQMPSYRTILENHHQQYLHTTCDAYDTYPVFDITNLW